MIIPCEATTFTLAIEVPLPPIESGARLATHPRFPGYLVCSDGSVFSAQLRNQMHLALTLWKRLRLKWSSHGRYAAVILMRDGRQFTEKVHRLVLESFVGPCPPGMQARHLDDDKSNNHLSNLTWGTHAENTADKQNNGRMANGSRMPWAKLSDTDVLAMREMYHSARGSKAQPPKGTLTAIAGKFGVALSTAWNAITSRSWKHVMADCGAQDEQHDYVI